MRTAYSEEQVIKQLLAAGPTVVAVLRLHHGIETKNTKTPYEDMTGTYASVSGGDFLTEESMRIVCGIRTRELAASDASGHDQ